MPQTTRDLAAFRDAVEVEAAISDHESIWRGRVVWKHVSANATVAVSPYYAVTRSGTAGIADAVREVVRAKWERAGAPLDIACGISANDPQLAKEIEIELLFDASDRT